MKDFLISVTFLLGALGLLSFSSYKPETLKLRGTIEYVAPNNFLEKSYREWEILGINIIKTKHKNINIYWQGFGGIVNYGQRFISYIQQAQKQGKIITFKLVGDSYSMHANTVCYYDRLSWNNSNAILYYHAPSYTIFKSKKYSPRGSLAYIASISNMNQCVKKGILTNKNIDSIMNKHKAVIVDSNGKRYIVNDE